MSGKFNIVFGFIYLTFTAILGPILLVPGKGEIFKKFSDSAAAVETMKAAGSNENITNAIASIMDYLKSAADLNRISSTAHAHGNLEALLNIAAGLVLIALVLPKPYKTALSALFIIGAAFHSGMLYLSIVFGLKWASQFAIIGVIALIAGLILMGIASIVGIRRAW